MNEINTYDLVIVGAGPAGLACAISLKESGYKVALLEKSSFPKDKICGDGLIPDVVNQLKWIDPQLLERLETFDKKEKCTSVLVSFDGQEKVSFLSPQVDISKGNYGYLIRRKDFDQLLFDWLKEKNHVDIYEDCDVKKIKVEEEFVLTETSKGVFKSKMIFAADGAHSTVKRELHKALTIDRFQHAAALRQYHSGVSGLSAGTMEFHFIKDVLPGYFWIFPLSDDEANVGIYVPSNLVSDKKLNLKAIMQDLIANHPSFKDRFKDSTALEAKKGYGLPLGGKRISISGNRYLLLGDAASVIDSVSGEGVGNAIRSGRFGAQHFVEAMQLNDFSARYNLKYDNKLYANVLKELKISKFYQRILRYPWILKTSIKKVSGSKEYQKYFVDKSADFHPNNPVFLFKFFVKVLIGR
jgi:menaquinone-9 beta-reductase